MNRGRFLLPEGFIMNNQHMQTFNMPKTFSNFSWRALLAWVLVVAVFTPPSKTAEAQTQANNPPLAMIDAIRAKSLGGQELEIGFQLSEPRTPSHFTTTSPPRIVVDFVKTNSGLEGITQPINLGLVSTMDIVEVGDRTRVIINLKEQAAAEIRSVGNQSFVTLRRIDTSQAPQQSEQQANTPKPADQSQAATTESDPTKQTNNVRSLTDVQFRRGEKNEARILVSLSDPSVAVDIDNERNKLTVDFINMHLEPELERRLDITDFGTVATFIDTFRNANGVRLTVDTSGGYTHVAYQTGNLYTIELSAKDPGIDEAEETAVQFSGERLSLNFQEISTRAVLQIIADFTGLNIVVSGSVSGTLTLRLKNVPWDQALDIILRSQGLAMRRNGNVILVGSFDELAEQERGELESQSTISELQTLQSQVFKLKYAQAEDILSLITGGNNTGGTDNEGDGQEDSQRNATPFLLSSRGSAVSDTRTNTVIVYDSPDRLDSLRSIIDQIDQPVRQVMIESRIVNVDDNAFLNLGTKFGYAYSDSDSTDADSTNNNSGLNLISGNNPDGTLTYGTSPQTGIRTDQNENLITSLPAAAIGGFNPASLFFILGRQGRDLLQLEISALEQDGLAETVSTPRVITANQQEANISQGFLIPFQEASSSGATTTSFEEATLSLTVTPQITPDDNIIMELDISDDSPAAGSTNISTRSVNTNVRVKNGDTVVLGGVMKVTRSSTNTKVPLLGDIPVLGYLFRNDAHTETKSELLVFVSPTLLPDTQ